VAQSGSVESTLFPYVQVQWATRSHQALVLALVDTGFDGYLALPSAQGALLGEPDSLEPWRLADGRTVYLPEYRGTLELVGLPPSIPAIILVLGEEFILGRAALNHFRITFDHGRRIIIEA
jgi:predicted aspartyl protease